MAERVLEQEPEQARGDRSDDEEPAEARIAVVADLAVPRERPRPLRMRIQSDQKKQNRTIAVARCVATRKVMKKSSF